MNRSTWFIIPVLLIISAFTPNFVTYEIGAENRDGDAKIQWISFEEALVRNEANPKMIFVNFYTEWCEWCPIMDANIFSNPQIAENMTNNYYAVKFNGESDQMVKFKGAEYGLNTEETRA